MSPFSNVHDYMILGDQMSQCNKIAGGKGRCDSGGRKENFTGVFILQRRMSCYKAAAAAGYTLSQMGVYV